MNKELSDGMADYIQRLQQAMRAKRNPVCVGLDPRWSDLPVVLRDKYGESVGSTEIAKAFEEFCLRVIDVVAPLVPVVKPQVAFFEELGPAGSQVLANVIHAARTAGLLVICDAKRGDIGSTAEAYARGFLAGSDPAAAPWGADALTVNPYMGPDTLAPFVDVAKSRGGGLYVLVRTSNPGAGVFQDLQSNGETIYQHVARAVEELAVSTDLDEGYGSIGAVVGATYPQELTELRELMPHVPLLVPGYGSQGAGAADVAGAFTANGLGAVVNSSRGILFPWKREPFRSQFAPDEWEAAVAAATHEMIADLASKTPASALSPKS